MYEDVGEIRGFTKTPLQISVTFDIHMSRVVSKKKPANSKKLESHEGYLHVDEEEVIRLSCYIKIFKGPNLHQLEQPGIRATDDCDIWHKAVDPRDHRGGNIFS